LAQLIPIGLQLLGGCDRFAASLIEGGEIAEERGGVGTAETEFFFYKFTVGADESQVEHGTTSLLDGFEGHGFPP
jgi:hypothetical protein